MIPLHPSKTVSVIVRTNNSDWIVADTLKCLFSQSFREFDLTVIDYSSSDRTREIVKGFPCKRYMISANKTNSGQVLNQTIEKTNGDIIVFLNADAVLSSPNSLRSLLNAFEKPDVQAAYGRQLPRRNSLTALQEQYAEVFPETGVPPDWIPFSLVFAAIRRPAWMIHPFSEKISGLEDIEWGVWAKQNQYTIQYVPSAAAIHSHYLYPSSSHNYVEGDADPFLILDATFASHFRAFIDVHPLQKPVHGHSDKIGKKSQVCGKSFSAEQKDYKSKIVIPPPHVQNVGGSLYPAFLHVSAN